MERPTLPARVRLPADIELEDRLAFGLTARQLLILAGAALTSYGLYALTAPLLPLPLALALPAPVALAGVLLAIGRLEALPADRLARAAGRHLRSPRRRVLAPEGIAPRLSRLRAQRRVAPLDLPVRAVLRSGLIEQEQGRYCVILRASGTSFALRSEEEQAALVEAFGRFLNALVEPIEITVRSVPVELGPMIAAFEQAAADAPQAALARAARDHARFLAQLAEGEGVHRRDILLVLGAHARERAAAQTLLERRAAEAQELLRPAGVELRALEGEETAALLARALDPPGPPAGVTLEGVVRGC